MPNGFLVTRLRAELRGLLNSMLLVAVAILEVGVEITGAVIVLWAASLLTAIGLESSSGVLVGFP